MHNLTLPHHSVTFWITAGLAMIILGMDKAGFGGGIGFVAAPLMALTISVPDAAALLLPLLIVADVISLRHYYGIFDRKSIRVLIPGTILGTFVAGLVFNYFSDNERILKIGLGILVLLFIPILLCLYIGRIPSYLSDQRRTFFPNSCNDSANNIIWSRAEKS